MAMRFRLLRDLTAAAFKLPWRVAVGLAILSLLAMHLAAGLLEQDPVPSNLADTGLAVIRHGIYVVALILEFLVPIGFLSIAGASLVKRLKATLNLEAAPDDTPEVVRAIAWREFESRICEAFRGEGYRVEERGRSQPDNEIDLIAAKAKRRVLIQCKHWKTPQVGVAIVRELGGVVVARRADGGVLVTGGTFTKEARDLAEASRIRLIDGDALRQILGSAPSNSTVAPPPAAEAVESRPTPAVPSCPKCGAGMVDRVAKQGKFAGQHFWVCSSFPKCKGISSALESPERARRNRSAA